MKDKTVLTGWRYTLHEIIYEADTRAGKMFDVILIFAIAASVIVVMLESVSSIRLHNGVFLLWLEWSFTVLFTIEYILRLICVGRPIQYARSFYGVIDLMAILPTYLSIFFPGSQYFLVIRVLRILRVFRVLKLALYMREGEMILKALRASQRKITVFLFAVSNLVMIFGALMYLIEGEAHGFTSIPRSIYWAIVTLTTVGYGDIAPQTNLGQFFAAFIMILGYSIIAVPTGIVTAEISNAMRKNVMSVSNVACSNCSLEGHDSDAQYCKWCGFKL